MSQSATAEGTVIIQSLQPSVITEGCSGWLRQEFHDLGLLDEITKLAFDSQLALEINSHHQNTLIRQFRNWKGINYTPDKLHPNIKWSQERPYPLKAEIQDVP